MERLNAVRLAQKTGGLFDTTDFLKLTSLDENNDQECDLLEGIDLLPSTAAAEASRLFEENSLEEFMDLSSYLISDSSEFGQDLEDMKLVEDLPRPLKRKLSVADDHDYTSKKPCFSEETQCEALPGPSILSASEVESCTETKAFPEDKYKERRRKNNIASRRSRETHKQKLIEMEASALKLEEENKILEKKILEMERLAKEMKAVLVKCLVEKK